MDIPKSDWPKCPGCKSPLDPGDFEWSGGATEAGTDFFTLNVECPCGWDLVDSDGWGMIPEPEDQIQEFMEMIGEYSAKEEK